MLLLLVIVPLGKADRTRVYESNEVNPDFSIGVPMLDGSLEEIEHLPFNKVIKTLDLMTCPSRSNAAALNRMQQQGQEWVDKVLASTPGCQNIWFVTDCQFWPWIGYGIYNNSAMWDELESCLKRVYWKLIGRGGVQRLAPVPLQQLDHGIYGIGCPHSRVECLVAQITKLLVHYGCSSGLGIQMSVTMELLLTELGLLTQPLEESFVAYGK